MDLKTMAKGAVGLTKAALGIHAADESVVKKRLAICDACEHKYFDFSEKYNMRVARCGKCKCFIRAKVLIKEEYCDDLRWSAEK